MKSAAWYNKHIADGDKALEDATKLLAGGFSNEIQVARANALIALGRAHYLACEVDANLQATSRSYP